MQLTVLFLFFNKEPDQSASFHKRKRWACWVYRAVLTLLAASSFGMSIHAVYQVTLDEKGATGEPWKAHEVTPNTSYRMWNPVSMSNDGLLLLNPSIAMFIVMVLSVAVEVSFPF